MNQTKQSKNIANDTASQCCTLTLNAAGQVTIDSKSLEHLFHSHKIPDLNPNPTPNLSTLQNQTASSEVGFISEKQLMARLPISRRTLFEWRRKGKIPWVRLSERRVLIHWPTVEAALLRYERGGES